MSNTTSHSSIVIMKAGQVGVINALARAGVGRNPYAVTGKAAKAQVARALQDEAGVSLPCRRLVFSASSLPGADNE